MEIPKSPQRIELLKSLLGKGGKAILIIKMINETARKTLTKRRFELCAFEYDVTIVWKIMLSIKIREVSL